MATGFRTTSRGVWTCLDSQNEVKAETRSCTLEVRLPKSTDGISNSEVGSPLNVDLSLRSSRCTFIQNMCFAF